MTPGEPRGRARRRRVVGPVLVMAVGGALAVARSGDGQDPGRRVSLPGPVVSAEPADDCGYYGRTGCGGSAVRGGAPTFLALSDGRVWTYDATRGVRLAVRDDPPAGTSDRAVATGGGRTVVVRQLQGCPAEVVTLGDGAASRTSYGSSVRSVAVSPDGTTLAYDERGCPRAGAGPPGASVVLRRDGSPARTVLARLRTAVTVDAVSDRGALLLTGDRDGTSATTPVLLLPAGGGVDDLVALPAGPGCMLAAPAFDGDGVVVWQRCGRTVRLLRLSPLGAAESADAPVRSLTALPRRTSVRAGQLLLELPGGPGAPGAVAVYDAGLLTTVVTNTGCGPGPVSCVRAPTW